MLRSHTDIYVVTSQERARKDEGSACLSFRVLAACLVAIATAVHYTDYGPLIPVMLNDLHIGASEAGLMSTLLFGGLAAASLPGGILADRYGQRPVLLGSLVLMVTGGICLPLWPNIYWILACRALLGFGSGAAFIAGAGIVAGVEQHAALAQGCYGGCVQVGSGLGLLLTPLLSGKLGWQSTFLFWGLVSVPALLAWCFVSGGQKIQRARAVDFQTGLCSPAVWSLGLAHMGTFGVGNALAAWISVYLVHQYGVSLALAATFGACGLIAGALLRPLGGFLLGHRMVGSISLLRAGTLLTCLGVGALAIPLRQPILAIVGMVSIAIGSTTPYTSVFDNAAHLSTVSKGVAQGLLCVIAYQAVLYQFTGNFTLSFGSILFFCALAINGSVLAGPAIKHEKLLSEENLRPIKKVS
jgi:MFS family permease